MKLSVKEDRKQIRANTVIREMVRYLLTRWHKPLCEKGGTRAWNARTVLVGKRFARLAALAKVLWTEPGPRVFGGSSKGPSRGSLFDADSCGLAKLFDISD